MRATSADSAASPFRQPKAVFAVAFACVVGRREELEEEALVVVEGCET